MNKLKYFKIFEAFNSIKLSRTIGFIKKEHRNVFLSVLKKVCDSIDIPYSKMSDEFFEYLPYQAALLKADVLNDTPCPATSADYYPEYSVEGNVCKEGKLRRKWGKGEREVVCPLCNGTGVKKGKPEIKLIKFWFSKDGKFICQTAVDGVIREDGDLVDPNSLTVVGTFPINYLRTGDYIRLEISGRTLVARAYVQVDDYGTRRTYAIQNSETGNSPNGSEWRKFGNRSWNLSDIRTIQLLRKEEESIINPFRWNFSLEIGYKISVEQGIDIKTKLSDADFAIIMDFGKLKNSGFVPRSNIKIKRVESKTGSKIDPDMKDENIKKVNIDRYINTIISNLDISTTEMSNFNKILFRIIGYKNALFVLHDNSEITNEINRTISSYIQLLSCESDSEKKSIINGIISRNRGIVKDSVNLSSNITKSLKDIKIEINKSSIGDRALIQIELIEKLESLSDSIYNKVRNIEIKNIEDFEITYQKIKSIKNIVSLERYNIDDLSNVISYITTNSPRRALSYLNYIDIDGLNNCIDGIEKVIRIIERI